MLTLFRRRKSGTNAQPTNAAAEPPAIMTTREAPSRESERQRISRILTCEHAKGREAFARHLAMSTTLTADQAVECLRLCPEQQSADGMSAFERAYARGLQEQQQYEESQLSISDRILRIHARVNRNTEGQR